MLRDLGYHAAGSVADLFLPTLNACRPLQQKSRETWARLVFGVAVSLRSVFGNLALALDTAVAPDLPSNENLGFRV